MLRIALAHIKMLTHALRTLSIVCHTEERHALQKRGIAKGTVIATFVNGRYQNRGRATMRRHSFAWCLAALRFDQWRNHPPV